MIKVGDLVMVVKPTVCCGNPAELGIIFTVAEIDSSESNCVFCGSTFNVLDARNGINNDWHDVSTLIKIDPPALQDETTTEKELAL